jgi:hypothetical protein
MKIVAVSYMLPPMLYPQAIQIGRLLSHSGHEITAVSGSDAETKQAADESFFGEGFRHIAVRLQNRPRGTLHWLGLRLLPFYGSLPDSYRSWANAAYATLEGIVRNRSSRPELIVTFGEPMSDHLLGLRLKQEFGIPWLAHFSDPWSDNPFRNIQPLSKLANRLLERKVIGAADATAFTSDETVRLVYRKYDRKFQDRAFVLPHAFDPAAYPAGVEPNGARTIMLRYIGNFYGHRSPRPLIRALAYLVRTNPSSLQGVKIELIGGIPSRMLRPHEWKALPEGLLTAVGSVSYEQSLKLMETSHILLTIDAPAQESVFFPSKLADYIGSGKRLLGIVPPGAAARIISECGGRSVSPLAPDADIASLLQTEIESVRLERDGNRSVAVQPSTSQYDIENVAPLFDGLCEMTVKMAHRPPSV